MRLTRIEREKLRSKEEIILFISLNPSLLSFFIEFERLFSYSSKLLLFIPAIYKTIKTKETTRIFSFSEEILFFFLLFSFVLFNLLFSSSLLYLFFNKEQ